MIVEHTKTFYSNFILTQNSRALFKTHLKDQKFKKIGSLD